MKNFQVKHGQCDSIIFPVTFSFGSSQHLLNLFLGDNRILLTGPGIYSHIYHRTPCPTVLICEGSNKQQRRGDIISNFTKGDTFFISYKDQGLLGPISRCSPSFHPLKKDLPLPFRLAKKRIYPDTQLKEELTYFFFESCQGVPYFHRGSRKSMINTVIMVKITLICKR